MKKLFKVLSVLFTVAFLFAAITACEITASSSDDNDDANNTSINNTTNAIIVIAAKQYI